MRNQQARWLGLSSISLVMLAVPVGASEPGALSALSPVAQVQNPAQPVTITAVRVSQTEQGLSIFLETEDGDLPSPDISVRGDAWIAEMPGVILALDTQEAFEAIDPAEGIARLAVVSQVDGVQIAITGSEAVPEVEVISYTEGLALTVIPGSAVAGEPSPASSDSEEAIQLIVTGEVTGYGADSATTATRTDTPLRDIPQSIQVIPEQVLEDQQVIRLEEALENVSGVSRDRSFGNTIDSFAIRGFRQDVILEDGFRRDAFQTGLSETANLERIEVLKGPASVLYGNLEPGGIINLVSERPLAEPTYEAELIFGSEALVRPTLDFSGPLTASGDVRYRLNAVYESGGNFRDFEQEVERFFIAPVLAWDISEQTSLLVEFDYLSDERPFDRGIVAIGEGIADIPFDTVLGEPDDRSEVERFDAGYELEHRFSENWRLRNGFRFVSADSFDFRADSWFIQDTGQLDRRFRSNDDLRRSYEVQTNVVGEFATGTIEHTLLAGIDLNWQTQEGVQRRLPGDPEPEFTINIFDLENRARPDIALSDLTAFVRDNRSNSNAVGLYLQDQIDVLDNLILVLGGRFDFFDQESTNNLSDTTFDQTDEAFSPRVGVVYQPIEPVSLYASFSRSFNPNLFEAQADGSLLEPERGTQYEFGVRGELLDGQLTTNLAAYFLRKTNVAVSDPDNSGFSIALGEVRSKGVELDIIGEILPGWNVIASYAYTNAEITEDTNDALVGNRLVNAPRHSASLWTTYEIQNGSLQGLGIGAGVFFVGERQGDRFNTFTLPSYVRTDAVLYYRRNRWRAALNVRNLFDIDYVASSGDFREYVTPGEPLTIIGSLQVEF